jgi:hypothetical protein
MDDGGGLVRKAFRKFMVGAVAVAIAGCAGNSPPQPAQAVAQNPAELLALLASPTTPAASRKSADHLFVEEKGAREPARLAVLEQIFYAPDHAANMRIYAIDALVQADPVRAGQALILYLPQLKNEGPEWEGVLAHACAICVQLGDDRAVESLIRSMRRVDVATEATWHARPEWGAIETLGGRPVPETLYLVVGQSRDRSARVAALDILQQIEPSNAIIQRIDGMSGDDLWLTDLRWWLGEFDTLPTGEVESIWIGYLHRPEQAALVERAVTHDRMLRKQAPDYVFAPRFAAVLAYTDESTIRMSRDALLADLQTSLAALPHPKMKEGHDETLAANEKKLTRADLLTLRMLLHGLCETRMINELLRQGLDDLSDTTTAHGGLLTMGRLDAPALIATSYPPLEGDGDDDYRASDTLIQRTVSGIALYHFNFQQIHNTDRAQADERDLRLVRTLRYNGLLITSITTRTLDYVYYTPAGAVVDLGVYASK